MLNEALDVHYWMMDDAHHAAPAHHPHEYQNGASELRTFFVIIEFLLHTQLQVKTMLDY